MNNIEKVIKAVSQSLGRHLCDNWADNGFCDNCPYQNECKAGSNALIKDIEGFLTDYIMEEE